MGGVPRMKMSQLYQYVYNWIAYVRLARPDDPMLSFVRDERYTL